MTIGQPVALAGPLTIVILREGFGRESTARRLKGSPRTAHVSAARIPLAQPLDELVAMHACYVRMR